MGRVNGRIGLVVTKSNYYNFFIILKQNYFFSRKTTFSEEKLYNICSKSNRLIIKCNCACLKTLESQKVVKDGVTKYAPYFERMSALFSFVRSLAESLD